MSYALDTNILARSIQQNHPMQQPAQAAVARLFTQADEIYVLVQNLYEFWVIATRPLAQNGLGLSPAEAEVHLARFEGLFSPAFDTPAVYDEWRQLVTQQAVSGKPAHDARIAAAMKVHGISHLLTFNSGDFKRFQHIVAVEPIELLVPPQQKAN